MGRRVPRPREGTDGGHAIKALTLTQPWASLVANGSKRIETRSWGTQYRGPLAIHAGKGLGGIERRDGGRGREIDLEALCASEPFATALFRQTSSDPNITFGGDLPRGAVVAVAQLVHVARIDSRLRLDVGTSEDDCEDEELAVLSRFQVAPMEEWFGNYAPGRYAWLLNNVEPLDFPVPCKGAMGLWGVPAEIEAQFEMVTV